jgi:hypothetical protein
MFFMAAGRIQDASAGPPRSIAAVVVSVVLGTAGFFALFAHEDPICWARNPATGESFRLDAATFVHGSTISMNSRDLPAGATESGCSSDSISTVEAVASLAIIATMLGAAWVLSKPSDDSPRDWRRVVGLLGAVHGQLSEAEATQGLTDPSAH